MSPFKACLGLIASISTALVVSSCSAGSPPAEQAVDTADAQFALTAAALPACTKTTDGQIFYVWADSNFVVCKGATQAWIVTNVSGLNAAIRTTQTGVAVACPTGGTIVQFGLDTNRNGALGICQRA
ncbi:MAG: hypothetical protein ABJB12_22180 [Pseudomonadota bacterium]